MKKTEVTNGKSERKWIASEEVEREIALGDRRAAYDALGHFANWVIGSLLLLNGAGVLATISQPVIDKETAITLASVYLFGLIAAIGTGMFAGLLAVHTVDRCEDRLSRGNSRSTEPVWKRQVRAVAILSCFALASFLSFAGATAGGLWVLASEGRTVSAAAR